MMAHDATAPSMLSGAISLAKYGWAVFPIVEKEKRPLTSNGVKDATTNLDLIRDWWKRWPNANIAIACGATSGVDVLDIDGPDAEETLRMLAAFSTSALPITIESRTARGRHLFFAHDGRVRNSAGKIGEHIDTRGEGGYVIVPPSIHPSGAIYAWAHMRGPRDVEPAAWPSWLLDLLLAEPVREQPKPRPPAPVIPIDGADHARRYVVRALEQEARDLAQAPEGTRNNALNRAAFKMGGYLGVLSEREISDALFEACNANGLVRDDGAASVEKTMRSGMRDGEAKGVRDIPAPKYAAKRGRPAKAAHDAPPIDEAPFPSDDDLARWGGGSGTWTDTLSKGARGSLAKSLGNASLILQHAPSWQGVIGYDERNDEVALLKAPPVAELETLGPYPRALRDTDETFICRWFEREWSLDFDPARVHHALLAVARLKSFDRVRDFLDSLAWDGVARADTWLVRLLGAEDTPLHRAIASKWLISAVARAFEPGCQADHVLVLEGAQGAGKSSVLRELAGRAEWFCDQLPNVNNKKAASEVLQGPWIVELAELDAIEGADLATIKAFITSRTDRYRAAYARNAESHPRRCVFAASTNEQAYLRDPSGGRRFWPVRINAAGINVAGMRAEREQLWAEAVVRYRAGERWYLDANERIAEAQAAQAERFQEDPWEGVIARYLRTLLMPRVTVEDCLSHLGFAKKEYASRESKRVVAILTTRLGWERRQRREGTERKWAYEPSPQASPVSPSTSGVASGDATGAHTKGPWNADTAPERRGVSGDVTGDGKQPALSGGSPLSPLSLEETEKDLGSTEQHDKRNYGGVPAGARAHARDEGLDLDEGLDEDDPRSFEDPL